MTTIDLARAHTDHDLVAALTRLAAEGRQVTADLIALLVALAERKELYAADGYGSLHDFCVRRLLLSDAQAYHRLAAADVARAFPLVLEGLREGRLTLTNVALLRPHLTEADGPRLLAWAEGRTKREVEHMVRSLAPLPDVTPSLRRLPQPAGPTLPAPGDPRLPAAAADRPSHAPAMRTSDPGGNPLDLADPARISAASPAVGCDAVTTPPRPAFLTSPAPAGPPAPAATVLARPAEIRPLGPARYSLRLTISGETHAKLQRARDLLGHAVPTGDLSAVLDRALSLLVADLERTKFGATKAEGAAAEARAAAPRPAKPPRISQRPARRSEFHANSERDARPPSPAHAPPRPRSRHIPAAVRRAVWAREEGRCGYVGPAGRCPQTRRLEFHHREPFAAGGPPTVENVMLLCKLHQAWEATRWFGPEVTAYRRRATQARNGGEPRDFDQSNRGAATRPTGAG